MYLHSLFRISMPACDMEPLDKGGYLQTVLPFSRSPFYQIGSIKTEVHAIFSYMPCINYVLSCSILLGLSARPVCSFLALDPDADVHGSSLMVQDDSDGHWHVSIDLSGSIAITKDHNQVAKLSSPLCTIATLSCQDWRFSNINSFTCTKLARP